MNITEEKELAELKEQHDLVIKDLSKKITDRVNQFAAGALLDFENHFKPEGFEITKSQFKVTATYKGLSVVLSHEDPTVPYLGTYLPFDLLVNFREKRKYKILVVSKAKKKKHPFDDNSQLEPIAEARENIQKTLNRLNSFEDDIWEFVIQKDPNKNHFPNMKDLLQFLFQSDSN